MHCPHLIHVVTGHDRGNIPVNTIVWEYVSPLINTEVQVFHECCCGCGRVPSVARTSNVLPEIF